MEKMRPWPRTVTVGIPMLIPIHAQFHSAVSGYMLHGPCSPQRSLENNIWKKCFPKAFTNQTIIKEDGYPNYANPKNGSTIKKDKDTFANKNVMAYWRELLVQFDWYSDSQNCPNVLHLLIVHWIILGDKHLST